MTIPGFRLVLAVAIAVGLPASAAGQTARDRDPLVGAFRDSLSRSEVGELRAIERSLMARVRRERTNPGLHLRLGMLALQLGENSDAASEFKWTTQLAPLWGVAWLGLGQAELLLGETVDTTRAGRQALLARDAWARASQAFGRALAVDPGQIGSLEALIADRIAADRPAPAEVIRDGVRRAAASRSRTAAVVLGLGRIERLLGDSTAALVAFEAAAALPGGRAIGLLESARIRLGRGEREALEWYLEAAALDEEAAVGALRSDLAWIATPAELERFDRLAGADRARFLAEFWARRDRNDLRQTGDRIGEHYRRLAVAAKAFPNREDQRFAVIIRHGEPTNRATARLAGLPRNESWWYARHEGDLVVHFVSSDDSTVFRLTESLFDLVTDHGAPAGDDRPTRDQTDQLLRSRAQLSPFYQAAAAGRRDQLGPFRVRERELGQAGRNLALTTDRFPLRFARDLPVRTQWLSLGSRTELVFAAPAFEEIDGVRSVRVRMVVWDSAGLPAVGLDTVVAGQSGFLRGHLPADLPPGRYSARVAIESGTRGAVVSHDLVVPGPGLDYPGDLALGSRRNGSTVEVQGIGQPIAADPWGIYERSDSIAVVAVVARPPGSPALEPRVVFRAVRADRSPDRWRAWPGSDRFAPVPVGADGSARISLMLPLRKMKAGVYEVSLEEGAGLRWRPARFVVEETEK